MSEIIIPGDTVNDTSVIIAEPAEQKKEVTFIEAMTIAFTTGSYTAPKCHPNTPKY